MPITPMRPMWVKPQDRDEEPPSRPQGERPTGEFRPVGKRRDTERFTLARRIEDVEIAMTDIHRDIQSSVKTAVAEAFRPYRDKLDDLEKGTKENQVILLKQEARADVALEEKVKREAARRALYTTLKVLVPAFGVVAAAIIAAIASHH